MKQYKIELNKKFEIEQKKRNKIEFERRNELDEAFSRVIRDGKKGKFIKDDGSQSKFDD